MSLIKTQLLSQYFKLSKNTYGSTSSQSQVRQEREKGVEETAFLDINTILL